MRAASPVQDEHWISDVQSMHVVVGIDQRVLETLSSEDEEWLTEMSMAELDSSTLSEDDSNYLVKSDDFVDASEFEDQHDLSQSEVAQKWTQALQTVESPNGSKAAAVRRATHRRRQNRTNSVEVPEFSPPSLVVEDTQEVKKSPPRLVWEPVTGTIATRPHQSVSFSGSTLTESLKREAEMNGPLKGKEEEKGKAEGDPLAPAAQVPHPNRGHRRRQGSLAGVLERISGPTHESSPSMSRFGQSTSDLNSSRRNYSPGVWLKQAMNPNASDPTYVQSFKKNKVRREFNHVHLLQEVQAHVGAIWTSEISPNGEFFISAGKDLKINLYRIRAADDGSNNVLHHACTYEGHSGDILCLSWAPSSKAFLSSSMDKTVRLWNVPKPKAAPQMHVLLVRDHLRFEHSDFVTAVAYHPNNEWFVTGCFDKKLRVWSIREKSVIFWVDLSSFITSLALAAQGRLVICGDHEGKATFFDTEGLRWVTQIHVRSRRGRNSKGKKISGIRVMPDEESFLITSNDSRVRLFRLSDFGLICKYKGTQNDNFQIVARPSSTGEYIICGSEANNCIIWNTLKRNEGLSFSLQRQKFTERKDRNRSYEFWRCSDAAVTVAMFLPPEAVKLAAGAAASIEGGAEQGPPQMVITCDETGKLLVFENKKRVRKHATMARGYHRGSTRSPSLARATPNSSPRGDESPRPRSGSRLSFRPQPAVANPSSGEPVPPPNKTALSSSGPIKAVQEGRVQPTEFAVAGTAKVVPLSRRSEGDKNNGRKVSLKRTSMPGKVEQRDEDSSDYSL